ncbi:MAG: zinc-ribbon domain-containing protein [Candidatus Bathyarchaeia archaeon]
MFCPNCGKEVPDGAVTCSYCGASTPGVRPPLPERAEFSATEVLGASLDIIKKKPIILLPHIITTVIVTVPLFLIGVSLTSPARVASLESLVAVAASIIPIIIVAIIVGTIIEGMYPLMVKNVLEGKEVEMSAAFGKAVRRFPSLIVAGILVGLLVIVGSALFVIPGIIFLTWYYYTVPSIMLENRGALDGMSASKRFGRTRKWKTFLMLLVLIVIGIVGNAFNAIPVAGVVISTLIGIIVAVWGSIIPAYAYIKYAMPTQTSPAP